MKRVRIYENPTETGQFEALGALTKKYAKRFRRLINDVHKEPYDLYDLDHFIMSETHMDVLIARLGQMVKP